MDKKMYLTPEMEVVETEMNVALLDVSNGGGDPEFGGQSGDEFYD